MSDRKKHLDQATENPFPIYSLEGLEWWLSRQPANREYDYCAPFGCLLCQYIESRGVEHAGIGSFAFIYFPGKAPYQFRAAYNVASDHPRTFGAALQRCRDAMGK